MAWKRGEALFDDLSLLDAVVVMNRYSPTQIRVAGADVLSRLRAGGIFRTGGSSSLARAMAALHGLAVWERPDGLELVTK